MGFLIKRLIKMYTSIRQALRKQVMLFKMKNLITLQTLFIGLNFFSGVALGSDIGERTKAYLEAELKSDYLGKLEKRFGDCGSTPESCLSKRDDFMMVSLPQYSRGEMCFPYTMCGFYHCMENTYHCSDVGVNYFTQLAFPTCSTYEANIKKNLFTDLGVQWIYSVMVCLQKGLVDECLYNGNCKITDDKFEAKKVCDHITDFTLSYHPGCYINSGVGVCHLPLQDKMNIWKTVNPFMTQRERQEAYKVIFECFRPETN
jgi:hypothetical protein